MAFSCGDGYAHRWACHLMMMMMNILRDSRRASPGETKMWAAVRENFDFLTVVNYTVL